MKTTIWHRIEKNGYDQTQKATCAAIDWKSREPWHQPFVGRSWDESTGFIMRVLTVVTEEGCEEDE